MLNTILKSAYVRTIKEQKKRFPHANETQLEYFFTYTTGGTIEIVRKWINDVMRIPSEEVVRILETMYMT
ncbi:TetR family transcriptional regulator C-terminal domain-containing protein [Neobacillus pocheonensis]|uniref:TetR family transcriptional regulator C-terminal domain-containing protein n=1 Tax=Neobacillus pocheonensis TaxID=363869 RepID=A0ABT0WF75_9BACI|nr:TetR family transcriptional regulator C-terminal domain-containing protein [Neobacillus pocheonensis]